MVVLGAIGKLLLLKVAVVKAILSTKDLEPAAEAPVFLLNPYWIARQHHFDDEINMLEENSDQISGTID